MRAVITVMGVDGVGIISKVSALLASNNINIIDISQTTEKNNFFMIMLVEMDKSSVQFAEVASLLKKLGEEIGQRIIIRHEKVYNSMHRI